MTHRLYYTDSYIRDFEANVVEMADEGRRVYLDQTAFYPTSGGQPFDTGHLGGAEVTDVVEEGVRIAHLLSSPLAGGRVRGRVDWSRRFDHMQQHTGQHLLSAVMAETLGLGTVGVHFGRECSTVDLEAGGLTPDQVAAVEARANQIVVENRAVQVSFEEAEVVAGLRKPSERAGTLRVVTIHDLDRSACGGTHVRATGELGAILIGRVERVRKGMRIEFVCGGRAIRRARSHHELLSRMASLFSAAPEELPGLIESQRDELKETAAARLEIQEKLDLCQARELYAAAAPDAAGIRRVTLREQAASLESLRGVAQAFTSMPKTIFVGAVPAPPAVILAASPDAGIDAATVLKSLLASVGGRGGGSARMAQGIVPGRPQLELVVESIGGRGDPSSPTK
ncbi:MAG: alanyl-tRNA editing protein [Gemmatimonadales bacterium]